MDKNLLADALDRVRLLATAGRFTDLSDGALLDRCVAERDEVAFTVLVDRHGAMVYGACYRILRHPHDAEDACQATFLVLAHKASGIRNQLSAASWLHGVARRVSLTLLRERAERRRREVGTPVAEPASAEPTDLTWSEVQVLLDEELDRLPERLRSPLVLCYLEGKTRDEAATALGLTPGRLHGLLQRGRTLLRDRLVKRGVTLGAGFLGAELSGGIGQALPPTLAVRVVNGGVATLRGQELGPALASAQVATLTNEVLRAMFSTKLKTASVWAACVGGALLLIGGGLFASGLAQPGNKAAPQADERKSAPAPTPQKTPAGPKPEGKENPKPKVLELRDLKDGHYTLRITHKAKDPKGRLLDDPIRDELYQPAKDEDLKGDMKGHREFGVRFSEKGKNVTISIGSREETVVTGELWQEKGDQRFYFLNLFAGGSLTLTQTKDGVIAIYTISGSGVPVLGSYKGQLTVSTEAPKVRDILIVAEPRHNEKGVGKSTALSIIDKDRIAAILALFPNALVGQKGGDPGAWKAEYRVHLFLGDGTVVTLTVGSGGKVWTTPANAGDQKTNGDFLKLLKELSE